MSAYRIGLTGKQVLFAIKKYKSHRCVPVSVIDELDIWFHCAKLLTFQIDEF